MKSFLFLLILLFPSMVYAQKLTYQDLKEGIFEMENEYGSYQFSRKDSIQYEENRTEGTVTKYKLSWLNDSTYTLQTIKYIKNPMEYPLRKDIIITVYITSLKDNSYTYKLVDNIYSFVMRGEMFLISRKAR